MRESQTAFKKKDISLPIPAIAGKRLAGSDISRNEKMQSPRKIVSTIQSAQRGAMQQAKEDVTVRGTGYIRNKRRKETKETKE